MKATTTILALFCATIHATQVQRPLNSIDDNSLKVPGDNPLSFCHTPNEYVLQLHKLDLTPDPPKAGQPLNIHVVGNLTKPVSHGSFAHIEVKFGWGIVLFRKNFDLCKNSKAVDEECPFHEGSWDVRKEVKMPEQIPPSKFVVEVEAYTDGKEEELITCISGEIDFGKKAGES